MSKTKQTLEKQTLEEVNKEIEEETILMVQWDKDHYDSEYPDSMYSRELRRLGKIKELLELGVEVSRGVSGIYVNNKYVVGYKQTKWRVNGKGKWYWYKNLEDFVERYVKTKSGLNDYRRTKRIKIKEEESVLND
tara:strand:+ start:1993 stop:2397 length:405 start_codon:yes stop_codon:yes gene_type:complete